VRRLPTALYNHRYKPEAHPTKILGAHTMPKGTKNKREDKKKATLTPKEKKAAKRSKQSKKEFKLVRSA